MLFDDISREYQGPALYSEPRFTYLNRSARPEVVRIRASLEEWFSHYPEGDSKKDVAGRFRSGDDAQYRSAFFELLLHELLLQLKCELEPHPVIEGTTNRPDFLVKPTIASPFYLELAVVSDESDDEAAARARINVIYDALDRLNSPDFFVEIRLSGLPASQLSARHVRAFLARNLASVDPDEITRLYKVKGLDALPRWSFREQDWTVDFCPIPKKPEARGKPGVRPIGAITSPAREIDPGSAIRDTLMDKAGHYGELNLPYVIAVNELTEFGTHTGDVMEALFGKEHALIPRDSLSKGDVRWERAPDGLWTSPSGPRYTRVSCVMIARVDAWDIPKAPICLYHNPWAQYAYSSPLTNLPQAKAENGEMKWFNGKLLGELLHLPLS
ncbi:MAG: hypothetical protein ACLPY5_03330 [Candidatus Bathyarchaeia archaeon]